MTQTTPELKLLIEQGIESLNFSARTPAALYQPIDYILRLKGKRVRPILTLLAYQAVSGRPAQQALHLALAVELFHNFTLMHDDIMDRAPVRRGMPTVHVKWDENVAILSGDALFACAMELVVKDFPARAAALAREFTRVALGVCEGQMEDMELATRASVKISDYLEMIRKKTAVLLGGCLSLAAIAGGAAEEQVQQMRELGECLGLGFQLQDDLMDAFPPQGFGKQVGGDIIENKNTYLMLRTLEKANPAQLETLQNLKGESDESLKVRQTLEIFRKLEIEQDTREFIHQFFQKARILSEELAGHIQLDGLRQYLQEIVNRKL